jgi:tRNA (guanine-N7-)-methyltransferase
MDTLFPVPQTLEVELGSGDGSFITQHAKACPTANIIGVERLLGRIRKTDRKGRRLALTNLRLVSIEASYFIQYLLPKASVQAIHVYFPDPWPKRKHWKNRLVNARFPELAAAALAPEGTIYLRTDDAPYFAQMTEVFGACNLFRSVDTPEALSKRITDFERTFQARGVQTRRAAYTLAN